MAEQQALRLAVVVAHHLLVLTADPGRLAGTERGAIIEPRRLAEAQAAPRPLQRLVVERDAQENAVSRAIVELHRRAQGGSNGTGSGKGGPPGGGSKPPGGPGDGAVLASHGEGVNEGEGSDSLQAKPSG